MTTVLKLLPAKIALVMLVVRITFSLSTPLPPKEVTIHSPETKKKLIELLAEVLLRVFINAPCGKKLVITPQCKCPLHVYLGIKTLHYGMSTTHEEVDVIIPQQVITAIKEGATYVKVISDGTDVFVLLLHFYIEWSLSTTVFFKGTGSNRNVTDIGKTAEKQKDVVPYLLAAHAFSGCDSVLKLYGLEKKSVCCLLPKYLLQHLEEASDEISDIQEWKTCIAAHYGIPSTTGMSEIRCVF